MREILFRGQTRRKGEKVRMDGTPVESNWVYGGIFPNNDGGDFAIIYQQKPEIKKITVYSDTVGQYTGLTDKNGKKIFEGDIIKVTDDEGNIDWPDTGIGRVEFYEGMWYVDGGTMGTNNGLHDLDYDDYVLEVIGNIFDNPELLAQIGGA